MANRMSTFSTSSFGPRSNSQQSGQISTTGLLNTLHSSYASQQPNALDAATSLVVNTCLAGSQPGQELTVDEELVRRAWEHARRRAEDGCIILGYAKAGSSFSQVLIDR
jgi:chitin synthase